MALICKAEDTDISRVSRANNQPVLKEREVMPKKYLILLLEQKHAQTWSDYLVLRLLWSICSPRSTDCAALKMDNPRENIWGPK